MVLSYFGASGIRKICKEGKYKKFLKFSGRILEMFLKSYILRTQFVHILYLVNGNHSFTLFPFYLINIFITKLLEEKPSRKGWLLFMCSKKCLQVIRQIICRLCKNLIMTLSVLEWCLSGRFFEQKMLKKP